WPAQPFKVRPSNSRIVAFGPVPGGTTGAWALAPGIGPPIPSVRAIVVSRVPGRAEQRMTMTSRAWPRGRNDPLGTPPHPRRALASLQGGCPDFAGARLAARFLPGFRGAGDGEGLRGLPSINKLRTAVVFAPRRPTLIGSLGVKSE